MLVLFALAVIGLTNIIVDSRLFEPVRCWLKDKFYNWLNTRKLRLAYINWKFKVFKKELSLSENQSLGIANFINGVVECHQCCGFWSGLLLGLILISWNPFIWFVYGCAGSFLCAISYIIMEFILSKTNFLLEEPKENLEEHA